MGAMWIINFRALLRVFDFFIPIEVMSAVLMVFALENVLGYYFETYVAAEHTALAWGLVYLIGAGTISAINLLTAEEDDLEDLSEDIEDL